MVWIYTGVVNGLWKTKDVCFDVTRYVVSSTRPVYDRVYETSASAVNTVSSRSAEVFRRFYPTKADPAPGPMYSGNHDPKNKIEVEFKMEFTWKFTYDSLMIQKSASFGLYPPRK